MATRGPRWYLHYDGIPPFDDDRDWRWTGHQWVPEDDEELTSEEEDKLEEWEERRRRRIAERNEY